MSIFGPAWFKEQGGEGNEFTCTHLFSARSTLVQVAGKDAWRENPAILPFMTYGQHAGGDVGVWANSNQTNTGYVRQLTPALIKRCTMSIHTNQTAVKDVGFRVYLARGGASTNKPTSGVRLERLLYSVPPINDIEYKTQWFKDNVNLTLYAGQTYGYYCLINDPVPSLPTGSFISITTSATFTMDVVYGGGALD